MLSHLKSAISDTITVSLDSVAGYLDDPEDMKSQIDELYFLAVEAGVEEGLEGHFRSTRESVEGIIKDLNASNSVSESAQAFSSSASTAGGSSITPKVAREIDSLFSQLE